MDTTLSKKIRPPMGQHNLKQWSLYALVGSVILGALIGIVVVLRGEWGWFEVRVILTTITIAVASLAGLACDVVRNHRPAALLPKVGLAITLVSAVLFLLGIWTEMDSEIYWKSAASTAVAAVATVHVCLLSIARLAPRFRWAHGLAALFSYGLAGLVIVMIFGEMEGDGWFRIIATMAIVNAALTLIVPLLHRISRTMLSAADMTPAAQRRTIAALDAEILKLRNRLADAESMRAKLMAK